MRNKKIAKNIVKKCVFLKFIHIIIEYKIDLVKLHVNM